MTLDELIDRLEKATGPDRVLDCGVAIMFGTGDADLDDAVQSSFKVHTIEAMAGRASGYSSFLKTIPHYTASLDAIVGLIERVLPGWSILIAISPHASVCSLHTKPLGTVGVWPANVTAKTAPLALCLAFVRALQAIK